MLHWTRPARFQLHECIRRSGTRKRRCQQETRLTLELLEDRTVFSHHFSTMADRDPPWMKNMNAPFSFRPFSNPVSSYFRRFP
jgi:hypothetical protein